MTVQPKAGDAKIEVPENIANPDAAANHDPWAMDEIEGLDGDLDMGDGVVYTEDDDSEDDMPEGDDDEQTEDEETDADEEDETDDAAGEDEPEADDADEATEEVAFDPEKWDGQVESLPPEIRTLAEPVLKNMERGLQMRFQEVAKLRKAYEAKLEAAVAPPNTQPIDEGPPPPPADDAPREEWMDWNRKQVAYFTKQEVEKVLGEKLPDLSKLSESTNRLEADRRMSMLTSQEGFDDTVAQRMAEIASEKQHWQDALKTSDELTLELFEIAKADVERAALKQQIADQTGAVQKAEAAEAKRKATSAKRAVSRPGGGRKSTGPAERFAGRASLRDPESMDSLDQAILEEYERKHRSA